LESGKPILNEFLVSDRKQEKKTVWYDAGGVWIKSKGRKRNFRKRGRWQERGQDSALQRARSALTEKRGGPSARPEGRELIIAPGLETRHGKPRFRRRKGFLSQGKRWLQKEWFQTEGGIQEAEETPGKKKKKKKKKKNRHAEIDNAKA